ARPVHGHLCHLASDAGTQQPDRGAHRLQGRRLVGRARRSIGNDASGGFIGAPGLSYLGDLFGTPLAPRPGACLAPIAVVLIFATGWTIAEGARLSTIGYVIAAACTLLFWKSHINPIPIIAVAGVLGWMRLI